MCDICKPNLGTFRSLSNIPQDVLVHYSELST